MINRNSSRTSTVHISLNFHPDEKLDEEKLVSIANDYMKRIGFGDQPYLVYEHTDAGHPHLHIVTTNIKQDGTRISLHNLGRNQSEKARQELENEYKLVKASGRKLLPEEVIPAKIQKLNYGKSEIKRSITNVLDAVLNTYNYTSLAELNAVLRLYNVQADRGEKDSRIYKNNGLIYHVLDKEGKAIGVPIKASAIYSKPTLKNLEEKFRLNKSKRESLKNKTRTMVNWVLKKYPQDLQELISMLKEEKITVVVRQNEQGIIYGLTYVDHRHKTVFNGSDLGKAF